MSHLRLIAEAGDVRAASPAPAPAAVDMTALVVRLADRYRSDGHEHPVAAATAVSARGLAGLDRSAFAQRFGLTEAQLDACESGRVALDDLPEPVGTLVERSGRIDLLHLADLERGDRRRALLAAVAARLAERDATLRTPEWSSVPVSDATRPSHVVEVAEARWTARPAVCADGPAVVPLALAMVRRPVAPPIPGPRPVRDARMRELALWTVSDFLETEPLDRP